MSDFNQLSNQPLLITTGEPAGVGMEILADVVSRHGFEVPLVATACLASFNDRLESLKAIGKPLNITLKPIQENELNKLTPCAKTLYILDTPCVAKVQAGTPNPDNAMMVKLQLDIAHRLAMSKAVSAIVTAPLAKSVMIEGGVSLGDGSLFSGHTEYFMQACGLDKVVMMLANSVMKVALVTTHIPLRQVADAITADEVARTVQIVHDELVGKFAIKTPKILVCGLNPHAGENGHLGDEEKTIINPVLTQFINQGMDISLALPADTLFTPKYLADCDAVIAMYHDQGLAPLKSHGFGQTVNITLGLPYIRTSVDHGTAFDLAGFGKADSGSLYQAMVMAITMANTQASTS